jgi:hypothetical protein
MQSCMRNQRMACNADHVRTRTVLLHRWGLFQLKKMRFKIAFTIRDHYTHQGRFKYTTFRPLF